MRQILIVTNNDAWQAERSRRADIPVIATRALDELPAHASILVGRRTGIFGGGPTRTGYVMVGGKAIGTTVVKSSDAKRGAVDVK